MKNLDFYLPEIFYNSMKIEDEIEKVIKETIEEQVALIEAKQWMESFRARVLAVLSHPALRN